MNRSKEWHEVVLFVLFVLFFAINLLDYVSTVVGLAAGKTETNWFALLVIGYIGEFPALVLIKILFTGLIGFTLWVVIEKTPKTSTDDDLLIGGLLVLNVIGFFVLANNFAVLGWNLI